MMDGKQTRGNESPGRRKKKEDKTVFKKCKFAKDTITPVYRSIRSEFQYQKKPEMDIAREPSPPSMIGKRG